MTGVVVLSLRYSSFRLAYHIAIYALSSSHGQECPREYPFLVILPVHFAVSCKPCLLLYVAHKRGGYRDSWLSQNLGGTDKIEPVLKTIFTMARQIDPNVLLFYNDYGNTAGGAKADAAYNFMMRFKKDGVPIDGIGTSSN